MTVFFMKHDLFLLCMHVENANEYSTVSRFRESCLNEV